MELPPAIALASPTSERRYTQHISPRRPFGHPGLAGKFWTFSCWSRQSESRRDGWSAGGGWFAVGGGALLRLAVFFPIDECWAPTSSCCDQARRWCVSTVFQNACSCPSGRRRQMMNCISRTVPPPQTSWDEVTRKLDVSETMPPPARCLFRAGQGPDAGDGPGHGQPRRQGYPVRGPAIQPGHCHRGLTVERGIRVREIRLSGVRLRAGRTLDSNACTICECWGLCSAFPASRVAWRQPSQPPRHGLPLEARRRQGWDRIARFGIMIRFP